MAKTQAALEVHLPPVIASVAHAYIMPTSNDPFDIAYVGHGELCEDMPVSQWPRALRGACQAGYHSLISVLVRRCEFFESGFFGACRGGHRDIVEQMIQRGVNWWEHGLEEACRGGHREIVDMM